MSTMTVSRSATLIRRAARFEAGNWRSLARWVSRRPDITPGDSTFAYHSPLVAPTIVILLASLIELVAVELLVPWDAVRIALLIVSIWGIFMGLGIAAASVVHPHSAGPAGLRVRYGTGLDIRIPWDVIAAVREARRSYEGARSVQLDDETLNVVVSGQTLVEIDLNQPVHVDLPREQTADITTLRLYTDDAAGLTSEIHSRIR